MSEDQTAGAHDVLLVGGGLAGLRAAIAVAETDPGLDVAVVSKVYPMRSHSVSAEGGAAGAIAPDDTLDEHAYDTVSGSDWLGDQDAIEMFVHEAPRELLQLEHWGCPWSRQPEGRVAVRAFGGMKKRRTWFAADKTGFHMLHSLFQTSLKYDEVARYDEWFVTRLLVDDGRVYGVVAVELRSGRIRAITAKAVVLGAGGCGKVFPFTTNANINTGDGMALAYRAGAPLKDMEMVQYHPTGLPFTGILMTEAARAEGGWLLNKDGYRYLQDYDLGKPTPEPELRSMELGPRDRVSQAFVHEQEKGRTIDAPYGDVVHLDLRHLGADLIDTKLPFVRELCLKYERIDPVTELIPVRPVVHYMMGGVSTDIDGATPLAGLYAAGETACVSINGANRLGSNSLPECLVFGARAGRAAAAYVADAPPTPSVVAAQVSDEVRRIERDVMGTVPRDDSVAGIRTADAGDHGGGGRDLPHGRVPGQGGRDAQGAAGAAARGGRPRHQPCLEHRAGGGARSRQHARHRRVHAGIRAAARGVARRPPAHRLPSARRRPIPRPPADGPRRRRLAQGHAAAGDDHPLATGRAGLREVTWRRRSACG